VKKIKNFYKEHRVFTILMSIVLVCVILIVTVLVQVFYNGNGKDKYGDRLEGIEAVSIADSRLSDLETNLTNDEKVKEVEVKITGKIVYFTIQFEESVSLKDAKEVAKKALENFSEDELNFYDFNFTLKKNSSDKEDGFLISGARNKSGSGLVWNNNREVTKDEEADPNTTEKDD